MHIFILLFTEQIHRDHTDQEVNRQSLPNNFQSVATNVLFPGTSGVTSYVREQISHGNSQSVNTHHSIAGFHRLHNDHLQFTDPHRPQYFSHVGQSFDSSGPYALPCLSGQGHACQCPACPSLHQHSASFPQCHTSQMKPLETDTSRPTPMNNINFRPEILAMNRNYDRPIPTYNPNIQSDGSGKYKY